MKTTVVPAQITTVEDKVAGNLSFTQLLLLVTPVFIDGAIFTLLPPLFNFSILKLMICIVVALACMTLAIRIRGKILLTWMVVIATYKIRPKFYLFNKNDMYLRPTEQQQKTQAEPKQQTTNNENTELLPANIPPLELVRLQTAVEDPRANFHFKVRKGGLSVHIREIKEESI